MRYDQTVKIYEQQTVGQNTVDVFWNTVQCKILSGGTKTVYFGVVQGGGEPLTVFVNDKIPFRADKITVELPSGIHWYPSSCQVLGRKTVLSGWSNA